MNENKFDLELEKRLREVVIPDDLKARLLEIPESSAGFLESATPEDLRSARWRPLWFVAIAVSTVGLVSLVAWWASPNANAPDYTLTQLNPAVPVTASNRSAVAAEVAELESLDRQLAALEHEYERLEGEAWKQNTSVRESFHANENRSADEELLASIIFHSAETCTSSGLSSAAVKEQLDYLVRRFEHTSSAELARQLLAQF